MMKQRLVIRISVAELNGATPVEWYVFDADEQLQRSGVVPLQDLPNTIGDLLSECETLVLVPGELVLLTSVMIPSRQMRQIKQALPYMVEELIADNIEDVHMAMPAENVADGESLPVAVVRHEFLINWLDQLYQHRIRPDVICTDSLVVPWRDNSRSFFVDGERVLYRDGLFSAQVFFSAQAAMVLPLLRQQFALAELGALPRYVLGSGSDNAETVSALRSLLSDQLHADVELVEYAEASGEVLATNAVRQRDQLINLLQGGYKVQRHDGVARWRKTALVAALGLLIYCGVTAASGIWFNTRAHQIEDQTFALYRQLFPQERRVVSPKKQMQAHLRGSDSGAISPLPLLAKSALGLRNNNVQLDEMRYSQQHNDLQIQLRAPTMDVIDRIKQQMTGVGLSVEINSATQRGAETLGRLHVQEQRS